MKVSKIDAVEAIEIGHTFNYKCSITAQHKDTGSCKSKAVTGMQ